LLVLVIALVVGAAHAASAAVEDHVPADAFLVLKVRQPARQFDRIVDSQLFRKLSDPSFLPEAARQVEKAREEIRSFERRHNVDVRAVLGKLLGREAAVAAFPGDMGALIIEGESSRSMRDALEDAHRVMRAAGGRPGRSAETYNGVTIQVTPQEGKGPRYHALLGNVLVVSEEQPAVRKVIDVVTGDAQALAATAKYRNAAAMMDGDAVVTGFLDAEPLRQVAAFWKAGARGRKGPETLLGLRLAELLPLMEFGVLSAGADGAMDARLTLAYRGERLPNVLQDVLPAQGDTMEVLSLAPSTAILAGARSLDPAGAWNAAVETMLQADPERAEQMQLFMDRLVDAVGGVYSQEQLLSELGGEFGMFVLHGGEQTGLPAAAVAVELTETAHIPVALESVVGTVATFATMEGPHRITVDSATYKGVKVNTVASDAPGVWSKLRPSFGIIDGYLVASTDEAGFRQIVDAARAGGTAAVDRPGTAFSALRISVEQVDRLLTAHREFLVRHSMREEGKSESAARRDLRRLHALLSLFESVEFEATFRPGRTDHYLRLRPAAGEAE
jgi:hypothetical protein